MSQSNFNNANAGGSHEPQLSADDQRLLDALVDAGFDKSNVKVAGEADAKRLDSLNALFGLMNDYPVEDAEVTLQHVTLARIDRHEKEVAARMKFDNQKEAVERKRLRIRVPDFITVAAVLLIAFSVFWPLLTSMRNKSMDLACANNMRYLGMAFDKYAAEYNGRLPVAVAGPMGSWDTFQNAINLQPLIDGQYCEAGHLNCAGRHDHAGEIGPSYSYRQAAPGSDIRWGTAPRVTIILGDLNPVVDAARSGRFVPPLSMSINHAGRGQNVLADDCATLWLQQPVITGDNIWLPNGADQLRSGLQPADSMDVFLTH